MQLQLHQIGAESSVDEWREYVMQMGPKGLLFHKFTTHTPLLHAIQQRCDVTVVKMLVEELEFDVMKNSRFYMLPVHQALIDGCYDTFEYLYEKTQQVCYLPTLASRLAMSIKHLALIPDIKRKLRFLLYKGATATSITSEKGTKLWETILSTHPTHRVVCFTWWALKHQLNWPKPVVRLIQEILWRSRYEDITAVQTGKKRMIESDKELDSQTS